MQRAGLYRPHGRCQTASSHGVGGWILTLTRDTTLARPSWKVVRDDVEIRDSDAASDHLLGKGR
jgi:hypothetical protein